jgi:hypothetical protein
VTSIRISTPPYENTAIFNELSRLISQVILILTVSQEHGANREDTRLHTQVNMRIMQTTFCSLRFCSPVQLHAHNRCSMLLLLLSGVGHG